jgi:uncharacterized protein (UPF0333 family)
MVSLASVSRSLGIPVYKPKPLKHCADFIHFMQKKGQVSVEYMILLTFLMGFVLVIFVLFQSYAQQTKDQVSLTQADQIARRIISASEEVYFLGEPSKLTIRVAMPDNIKSVSIGNNELFFVVNTQEGDNEIGHISKVNITGSLPTSAGVFDINIESKGDYVEISAK